MNSKQLTVNGWIFLLFTAYCLPFTVYASTLNEQAEQAWSARADNAQTEKAVALWQQSLKENPEQPELWIRITNAMNRLTRRTDKTAAKQWAERARDAARIALEKNPQSSSALTNYAEALGQWANTHKGLGSLKMVKQAVKSLNQAIALDPKNGYAHMLLSEFYRKAPSTLSVGDKRKALVHAKLAVDTEPDRAVNHRAYASALMEHNEFSQAVEQLQFIVKMTPRPDLVPETRSNQEDARAMLNCLEKKKGKDCAN